MTSRVPADVAAKPKTFVAIDRKRNQSPVTPLLEIRRPYRSSRPEEFCFVERTRKPLLSTVKTPLVGLVKL